jgi:flavodoxin/Fe-S-cluster-containing hydrogenase component 2
MKCLIIYYSLTNSTSQVAKSISIGLKQAGVETTLCNIKDTIPPDLENFDLLGIGTPVYVYQIPINVQECIESLSNGNKIRSFAFLTYGTYAWNAGELLKKAMLKSGFDIQDWFYCHGADYFLGYISRGCFASPGHPNTDDLVKAQKFGFDMGAGNAARLWPESHISPPLIYRFEQMMLSRSLVRGYHQKQFKLDKEKCIKCDICVKGCPVHNLNHDNDGFPSWDGTCIMCLSCEMHCPREAIKSPMSTAIMNPFMNYNVKKIMRDPKIEKSKVRLHNGKIVID